MANDPLRIAFYRGNIVAGVEYPAVLVDYLGPTATVAELAPPLLQGLRKVLETYNEPKEKA